MDKSLTFTEGLLVSGIAVIAFNIIITRLRSPNYLQIWSPIFLISALFIYYAVIGPVITVLSGETYFRLVEHRHLFEVAWIANLLAFLSMLLGYQLTKKPFKWRVSKMVGLSNPTISPIYCKKFGRLLFIFCLLIFAGFAGSSILRIMNPISGGEEMELNFGGNFTNYFILPIAGFVPALSALTIAMLHKKISKIEWFAFNLAACGIYLSLGFRYRIVLVLIAVGMTYFFIKKKKPNLVLTTVGIVLFIGFMGFVQMTRTYFGGLDVDRVSEKETSEFFLAGLNESNIFMTSGMLISQIPENYDFIYHDQIIQAATIFIPRSLWPGKPAGRHQVIVYSLYNPEDPSKGRGVAFPLFILFYFSFGWLGLIIGSVIFGHLLKRLFLWFILNQNNSYALIIYSSLLGSMYFIFSRGYLPAHVMLLSFTLIPCFLISKGFRKYLIRQQ